MPGVIASSASYINGFSEGINPVEKLHCVHTV